MLLLINKKVIIFISLIILLIGIFYLFYEGNSPPKYLDSDFLYDTEYIEIENVDSRIIRRIIEREKILKIVNSFKFKRLSQIVYTYGTPEYKITFKIHDYEHYMYYPGKNDTIETSHYLGYLNVYCTKLKSDIKKILFNEKHIN